MPTSQDDSDLLQQIDVLKQRIVDLENELVESENNFRTITDSAPVGIFFDNTDGKATYINKKCADLIGVSPEDALNLNWIPFLHPDDREMMVSEWQRAFKNNEEFHLQYRWVHSNGKIVWTHGDVIPIRDETGKTTMFIGALTDITALKEAELESEKLRSQLAQSHKMESIGRLAGGVAHDYNNMLTAIIGYTEIAKDKLEASSPIRHYLDEVLNAANRSAEMTRQLLGFARKQPIIPVMIDVNTSVTEMLNMLRHLIGENIELTWLPGDEEMNILMDPTQLDRILANICINARDAITGIGAISITTMLTELDDPAVLLHNDIQRGTYVKLSITDDGCGMDEETVRNIFEPFFTTKTVFEGTGLGLASVYGTVKQNNGFIDVQSKLGQGSTFDVYLPINSDNLENAA